MRTIKNILQSCVIVFFIVPNFAFALSGVGGSYEPEDGDDTLFHVVCSNPGVNGVYLWLAPDSGNVFDGIGCNNDRPWGNFFAVEHLPGTCNTGTALECLEVNPGIGLRVYENRSFGIFGNFWATLITGGLVDLGIGFGLVFLGVIVLVVAVFVFRRGLKWLRVSAGLHGKDSARFYDLSKEDMEENYKRTGRIGG